MHKAEHSAVSANRVFEGVSSRLDKPDLVYRLLVVGPDKRRELVVTNLGAPLGHFVVTGERGAVGSREAGLVVDLALMFLSTVDRRRQVDSPVEIFVVPAALVEALANLEVKSVEGRAGHIWDVVLSNVGGVRVVALFIDDGHTRGVKAVFGRLGLVAVGRTGAYADGEQQKNRTRSYRHAENVIDPASNREVG